LDVGEIELAEQSLKWMERMQESEEITRGDRMPLKNVMQLQNPKAWFCLLSKMEAGVPLPRTSMDIGNMEKQTIADMVKEAVGQMMCTKSFELPFPNVSVSQVSTII
jgi:hypothetical protein